MKRMDFFKGFLTATVLAGIGFTFQLLSTEEVCQPPNPLPNSSCGQSPLTREVSITTAQNSRILMGKFAGMAEDLAKSSNNPAVQALHSLYWRFLPNAFTIPKDDLQDIINCTDCPPGKNSEDVAGARVYTAIRCGMMHLFMVPVEISGADTLDMIPQTNPSDTNSRYVYNFIHPCPNTCDNQSAMDRSFRDGYNHPFAPCDIIENPCDACKNWSTPSNPN